MFAMQQQEVSVASIYILVYFNEKKRVANRVVKLFVNPYVQTQKKRKVVKIFNNDVSLSLYLVYFHSMLVERMSAEKSSWELGSQGGRKDG